MKKIVTIIGARPQFIKAAVFSNAVTSSFEEILVHTGQHYDTNMSDVFFSQLSIPKPKYNLEIGSSSHGKQTGLMLEKIEEVLFHEKPDALLTYGDTNSTLAGALAAAKLYIPAIHIEAGLRSFNKTMPEEINRIVADATSDILFCPTKTAVANLKKEGRTVGVYLTGDIMYDLFQKTRKTCPSVSSITTLKPGSYYLATIHRPYNTDYPHIMKKILECFAQLDKPVLFPVHPRTEKLVASYGMNDLLKHPNIHAVPPAGYLEMQSLELNAYKVITDSGGVQKEAYFAKKQCFTLRYETEWVETLKNNWNILCHVESDNILEKILTAENPGKYFYSFGKGDSCPLMNKIISEHL